MPACISACTIRYGVHGSAAPGRSTSGIFSAIAGTHRPCTPGELLGSTTHSARCVLAATPGQAESPTSVRAEPVEAPVQGHPDLQSIPNQPPSAPQAPQPLLQVTDLSVRFPLRSGLLNRIRGNFTAVDHVSFSLAAGQTLALVG